MRITVEKPSKEKMREARARKQIQPDYSDFGTPVRWVIFIQILRLCFYTILEPWQRFAREESYIADKRRASEEAATADKRRASEETATARKR